MTSNTQGDTPPIQPTNTDIDVGVKDGEQELRIILMKYGQHCAKHGFGYSEHSEAHEAVVVSTLAWHQQALERERLEAALFALDNETLWQYMRKCNSGEASKANRGWLLNLIESNISRYESRLSTLTNKDKDNAR